MKLNESTIEAQSTAVGVEAVAMGIRAEDMAHIMGVLTDLYTNRPRAVIREYSTNGHDAHVDAGVTRPIEVTLPRSHGLDYSPFLTIRDYGSGLDKDDIAAVYSQYGRSTKRDSNDFNGALGLGCKAALTYCSLFTVESVKNAVKTIVEVGRAEGGGGVMKVIAETPTTDPNGTKVTVPVGKHDLNRFATEARDFYQYWKPGTVLVDGKQPQHFTALGSPLKVRDDLFVLPESGGDKIVMGNVAYPAPELAGLIPRGSVLAFVPLGDVNFPPSRETLADTATTRATIQRLKDEVQAAVVKTAQQEIEACGDGPAVVRTIIKWREYLPATAAPAWTFKGTALPHKVAFPLAGSYSYDDAGKYKMDATGRPVYDDKSNRVPVIPEAAWNLHASENGYRLADASNIKDRSVWDFPNTVWIEDFAPGKFTANHKKKLRIHYRDTYGTVPRNTAWVLLRGKVPAEARPWIDAKMIVDYDTIKAVQLPTTEGKKVYVNGQGYVARIPGSYDVYLDGEYKHGLPGDKFPPSYPIFYMHGNEYQVRQYAKALAALHTHSIVVCLPANRIDKFKRDVPKAVEASDGIRACRDTWVKKLTPDQRLALTIYDSTQNTYNTRGGGTLTSQFAKLDASKIKDPDLRKAVQACKIPIKSLLNARGGFAVIDSSGLTKTQAAYKVAWKNPLDKYPLFNSNHPEESTRYLNAEYRHLSV